MMSSHPVIRPETGAGDYSAIASVVGRAFAPHYSVPHIIALKRQRQEFDPELSLVAEVDGQVVGHILFTPMTIRLLDQAVKAVNLSPLGISPEYQRQGIGGLLIEEGHRIATAKGYTVANVLGHPPYYPRFGYKTHVYGSCSIEIAADRLPNITDDDQTLISRHPTDSDVPALQKLWLEDEHNVDFAFDPGGMLLDWISPNPAIQARVYLRGEQIVGYTRGKIASPNAPEIFLSSDADAACWIAGSLVNGSESLKLPIHQYSASGQLFAGMGTVEYRAWDAGMARSLVPDTPFDEFYARLQRGERLPGHPNWGTVFELD
jgi:predicted N-acetyltransferase YhbS